MRWGTDEERKGKVSQGGSFADGVHRLADATRHALVPGRHAAWVVEPNHRLPMLVKLLPALSTSSAPRPASAMLRMPWAAPARSGSRVPRDLGLAMAVGEGPREVTAFQVSLPIATGLKPSLMLAKVGILPDGAAFTAAACSAPRRPP